MWYNTQIRAKPPRNYSSTNRHKFQSTLGTYIINPRERLLNTNKRQKLRDLLIDRFSSKYNLGKNRMLIEGEITKFIQQEKLNDVDLKRLDARIKRIISEDINQKNLKKNLTENLNYNQPIDYEKEKDLNTNLNQEESIYPNNYQPPLNSTLNQNNQTNLRSNSYQPNNSARPLSSQTYIPQSKLNLYKTRNKFSSPEEELKSLETELAAEEERELREKGYYSEMNNHLKLKKIDFKKYGNEWAAMAAYDKMIYEQQILDEKIRSAQQKKRTKYDLDEQVKEKIKKEYEDELKEKEYDKIFKEHQKELDKIEKEKAQKIKEQYIRERESRKAQLKDNYIRKRIDELKERKFDKKFVRTILTEMENERKQQAEEKRRRNLELNKALEENEKNRKNLKIIQDKQKVEDLQFLEEQKKMDIRLEQQREYLLNQIKTRFNNASNPQAEEKVKEAEKAQQEEDKKIIFYMNEKCRIADEKELKEKIRRQKEKKELKKYYDMQVEEKKKDEEFEKVIDGEQARIWKKDCEKYNEDEKRIAKIIWDKNVRNLNTIKDQIKDKKEKEKNNMNMTPIEFSMNREKLMKVKEALS
jgi:hypothetical protein